MKIEVSHIKKINAGSLKGFVTLTIDGIIIRDFRIVQQADQAPWISPPHREYKDKDGNRKFSPLVVLPKNLKAEVEKAILEAYKNPEHNADVTF